MSNLSLVSYFQMQLEKISLSSQGADPTAVAMEMASNARGAELEADFLQGNVSTEDEPVEENSNEKLLTSKDRYRAIMERTPSPRLIMSPVTGQRSPVPLEQSFQENENMNSTSITDQGPVPAKGSPTLRRSKLKGNRGGGGGDRSDQIRDEENTPLQKSLPRSVSRCSVSSKKLKEIPKDDPRLSLSDVSLVCLRCFHVIYLMITTGAIVYKQITALGLQKLAKLVPPSA